MGSDCISLNDIYQNTIGDISSAIANTTTSTSTQNWITATNSGLASNYSYITTDDLVYRSRIEDYLLTVIKFLGEKEVDSLLEVLLIRGVNEMSDIKGVITYIIRHRHFSEDFLLKYFEHVTIEDIRVLHSADIASHDYPALALMIESKEC